MIKSLFLPHCGFDSASSIAFYQENYHPLNFPGGEDSLFVLIASEGAFLPRFTYSRCAGYLLFLDTYSDNINLGAAKT